jgi:hypothetical protein
VVVVFFYGREGAFWRSLFVLLQCCVLYHSAHTLVVSNMSFLNVRHERNARKILRDTRYIYVCIRTRERRTRTFSSTISQLQQSPSC